MAQIEGLAHFLESLVFPAFAYYDRYSIIPHSPACRYIVGRGVWSPLLFSTPPLLDIPPLYVRPPSPRFLRTFILVGGGLKLPTLLENTADGLNHPHQAIFPDFLYFFSWFSPFSVPANTFLGRWRHIDVTMTAHEICDYDWDHLLTKSPSENIAFDFEHFGTGVIRAGVYAVGVKFGPA